jgi:hypothetical protein
MQQSHQCTSCKIQNFTHHLNKIFLWLIRFVDDFFFTIATANKIYRIFGGISLIPGDLKLSTRTCSQINNHQNATWTSSNHPRHSHIKWIRLIFTLYSNTFIIIVYLLYKQVYRLSLNIMSHLHINNYVTTKSL